MQGDAEEVLRFWLDEVGPEGWYAGGEALDQMCRSRFLGLWERGAQGELDDWACGPRGALGLVVLLDQLPRNMFRGDARAFASDGRALANAKDAINRGLDLQVADPERQFLYMPLMHSEIMADQDRSVRLFLLRIAGRDSLKHAIAHRAVIRRFGRFPYRNAALGRKTTPEEAAFLAEGGYAAAMREAGIAT